MGRCPNGFDVGKPRETIFIGLERTPMTSIVLKSLLVAFMCYLSVFIFLIFIALVLTISQFEVIRVGTYS